MGTQERETEKGMKGKEGKEGWKEQILRKEDFWSQGTAYRSMCVCGGGKDKSNREWGKEIIA